MKRGDKMIVVGLIAFLLLMMGIAWKVGWGEEDDGIEDVTILPSLPIPNFIGCLIWKMCPDCSTIGVVVTNPKEHQGQMTGLAQCQSGHWYIFDEGEIIRQRIVVYHLAGFQQTQLTSGS